METFLFLFSDCIGFTADGDDGTNAFGANANEPAANADEPDPIG